MSDTSLRVAAGAVVAYRLYDVAYAIDLPKAEAVWARRARPASTRARLNTTPAKAMAFGVPPVEFALEPVALRLDGAERIAEATARLYDFGVLTLTLRLPVAGLPWAEFAALVDAMDRGVGEAADNAAWARLLAEVRSTFADALIRPADPTIAEDYLIAEVRSFGEPLTADQLQQRLDLVPLL